MQLAPCLKQDVLFWDTGEDALAHREIFSLITICTCCMLCPFMESVCVNKRLN